MGEAEVAALVEGAVEEAAAVATRVVAEAAAGGVAIGRFSVVKLQSLICRLPCTQHEIQRGSVLAGGEMRVLGGILSASD